MLTISRDSNGETILEDNSSLSEVGGSFYTTKNGQVSFHIENINGELHVQGMLADGIRIWHKDGIHWAKCDQENCSVKSCIDEEDSKRSIRSSEPILTEDDTGTIELFILVDNLVANKIVENGLTIENYLGIHWNLVQRRFTSAKIKFTINAASIIKDMSWFDRSLIKPGIIDSRKELIAFGKWLYKYLEILPAYDVAFMHTGMDLAFYNEGEIDISPAGTSLEGSLCQAFEVTEQVYSCGIGQDMNPHLYVDVLTSAHEMGHILGAPHDGDLNAERCKKMGYIMEPDVYSRPNQWFFSPCSLELMRKTINVKGHCLQLLDVVAFPRIPILNQFPHQISIQDYCKAWFGPEAYVQPEHHDICREVVCIVGDLKYSPGGAPEGTSCSQNKICLDGACVTQTHY